MGHIPHSHLSEMRSPSLITGSDIRRGMYLASNKTTRKQQQRVVSITKSLPLRTLCTRSSLVIPCPGVKVCL